MGGSFRGSKRFQMSDSFLTAALVALSGGAQDAYTYCCRDRVYANAQTGNIVLMSSNLMSGKPAAALKYLFPVLAFLLGVFAAEHIRRTHREGGLHWRQTVVLTEIGLLFAVGFIPQGYNAMASAIVSFVCAMQVQTFRKVCGNAYASTMCIGNMRSSMEALHKYVFEKEPTELLKALIYFGVIGLFGVGAGLGYILTARVGERAIWLSCVLLAAAFAAMLRGGREPSQENNMNENTGRIIMKAYQREIDRHVAMNELTSGGGLVIFGGAADRNIPLCELKQAFELSMPIYNRSLTGLRLRDAKAAYDACAAELSPESVMLHLGADDIDTFKADPDAFEDAYRALITHVKAVSRGCRVAVVSVDDPHDMPLIREMNRRLKNLAQSERCEFCEINGLVWDPKGTRELMGFMYEVGFLRPLKIKRPLFDLAKIFYGCVRLEDMTAEAELDERQSAN